MTAGSPRAESPRAESPRAESSTAGHWWRRWIDRLTFSGDPGVGLGAQFRKNLPLHLLGVLMLAGQQAMMAKRDFLVKAAVDAIGRHDRAVAVSSAGVILIVSVGAMVVRLLSRATMFTAGRNVEYELRGGLLKRIHRLGPTFFAAMPTGEIMSRATNDLQQVRMLLGFGVLTSVGSAFALVSALYVMLDISWQLTLAALSSFPLLILITKRFSTAMFVRTRANQQAIGKMSDRVLASLAGVRVVRSFAMEDAELLAFEGANEVYLQKSLDLARLRGSMGPIFGGVSAFGVLVVFWYGGTLLSDPTTGFSTGDFVAFWLALLRLTWPLMAVGFVASIIQRGRAGYERLRTIFDAKPEVVDNGGKVRGALRGALKVCGLSFCYGSNQVLCNVSFEVAAGKSLAIVGRTGSGKSTLAALLSRLLPTHKGTVFLDDNDVCDLSLEVVRGNIGYAQQDAFLFSTTVAQNIGYALDDSEVCHERIEAAAREAQVFDDIRLLPDGFETVVGERGVQLSGGQKQRIALARALIREPPILVLDDPLSAVDGKTEAAILQAIERQAKERTVILITHRIAAAKRCDSVLVLEKGHLIEEGSHDELLETGGIYALFAEEQRLTDDLVAMGVDSARASDVAP